MLYIKNLYEGGRGWAAQCRIRLLNFLLISERASSGVAEGPIYMPRYLPLVWVVSIESQEREESRALSSSFRGE